jgi:hypothetical protein
VAAVLSCPALVAAHADLRFRQAFEHRVRLSAEAGVHALVAPTRAYASINSSSSGGGRGGDDEAASRTAASRAPAADGAVDADDSDGDAAVRLAVGQSVLAQVLVGCSHSAELLLLDAELGLEQESGLKVGTREGGVGVRCSAVCCCLRTNC